jgi:formyltetrahydrofolate-dependent phosphoribosylglycinamide formyltransferase
VSEVLNIGVFASGRGSNFAAILRAIETGKLHNVSIAAVISNNSDAPVLTIARERNIPSYHLNQKQYSCEEEFDEAVLAVFRRHQVNFIVLAGYMKKLSTNLVCQFRNRTLNIHPALLPKFGGKGMYGMHVHEAVINSGEKISGVTIHIVDEEYDHGPIVRQRTVAVDKDETPDTLALKIHGIEHQLYPEVLQLFADDRVRVNKGQVTILENGAGGEY